MTVNVPAETVREGILVIGPDGDILFASQRAGEILTCDPESLLGDNIMTLVDGPDRPRINAKIQRVTTGTTSLCEVALVRPGEARVNVLLSMGRLDATGDEGTNVCLALTDLSEEQRLREELQRLAGRDELTGLHDRHYLTESLLKEWRRARRYGHPLSCLMIEIDDFEAFNGSRGHAAGDALLRQTAELIRGSMRETDVVARYADGQFCVLMPETPLAGAMTAAERLRFAMAAQRFTVDGRPESITVSIGAYAHGDATPTRPDTLLEYAGAALRKASASGKNRTYGPPVAPVRPSL